MFEANITMGQAVIVCVFSLAVVFLVLLALSYIIDLTAWILKKTGEKKAREAAPAAAPTVIPEGKRDAADVALIAAAVAAYLGKSSDQYAVRSIRRVADD